VGRLRAVPDQPVVHDGLHHPHDVVVVKDQERRVAHLFEADQHLRGTI
jgi:hypothetical protein